MRYEAGVIRAFGPSQTLELEQIRNAAVFAALTALGAKVYIPHEPIPFTLQTLFVVLAGAFLGKRGGTMSMLLYLVLGAAGFPVFAGPEAGLAVFAGPTAGYLLGFVAAAAVVGGTIGRRSSFAWTVLSILTGFTLIFACGSAWLNFFFIHNWSVSVTQGFLIFSFWDLVKLAAAVAVYRALVVRNTPRTNPSIDTNHKSDTF